MWRGSTHRSTRRGPPRARRVSKRGRLARSRPEAVGSARHCLAARASVTAVSRALRWPRADSPAIARRAALTYFDDVARPLRARRTGEGVELAFRPRGISAFSNRYGRDMGDEVLAEFARDRVASDVTGRAETAATVSDRGYRRRRSRSGRASAPNRGRALSPAAARTRHPSSPACWLARRARARRCASGSGALSASSARHKEAERGLVERRPRKSARSTGSVAGWRW
jgi:hypothetical protein